MVDRDNDRIQKFTNDGVYLTTWGAPGSGMGELQNPVALTVSPNDGLVYATDVNMERVLRYTWILAAAGFEDGNIPEGWTVFL